MADLRQALEEAIFADPDDKSAHMAYADYLSEQGDPRGEFIQTQLALEDQSLPAASRKKLKASERRLLKKHQREWLGELAPFLLGGRLRVSDSTTIDAELVRFEFRRGWLDRLELHALNGPLARALPGAAVARNLRHLAIDATDDDEFGGEDSPSDEVLKLLSEAPFLPHLLTFRLGAPCTDEIDPGYLEHGEVYEDAKFTLAWNDGSGVIGIVGRMTRLEEFRLFCLMREQGEELYDLAVLANLRVFQACHLHDYDLGKLANLPGPPRLEQLLLMPHAVWPGGTSYLPRDEVIAFLRSDKVAKLTHLQLRMSDLGDEGVNALIDTGLIRRLEMLDLRHGEVTDAGALALAKAIPGTRLRQLDLQRNRLTPAGIEALVSLRLPDLRTDYQQVPDAAGAYNDQYLYDGDWE